MHTSADLKLFIEEWRAHLRENGREPNTIKTYCCAAGRFAVWLEDHGEAGLTAKNVARFVSGYESANTRRSLAKALKVFSSWLAASGKIRRDALTGYRPPKADLSLGRMLTHAETDAIAAACDDGTFAGQRDRAFFLLLLSTGARIGELLSVCIADLDTGSRHITFRDTKGDADRMVLYDARAADAVGAYLTLRLRHGSTGPLWLTSHTCRKIGYKGMADSLKRRADTAGVAGYHAHMTRNTFAVGYLEAGGTPDMLRVLCGWEDPRQLAAYVRLQANRLALREARQIMAVQEEQRAALLA